MKRLLLIFSMMMTLGAISCGGGSGDSSSGESPVEEAPLETGTAAPGDTAPTTCDTVASPNEETMPAATQPGGAGTVTIMKPKKDTTKR